jgi:outer membrane receptor for ferrienterochelin and colicin
MKLSPLALAIAVLPGLSLAAEPYVAEPLVITSGRLAEPQAQATAATTVFERADIERLQVSSVPDLLSRVPGVSIVQNGGRGSLTSLFLRGANANQTLVLVDGVRLNAAASRFSPARARPACNRACAWPPVASRPSNAAWDCPAATSARVSTSAPAWSSAPASTAQQTLAAMTATTTACAARPST